MQKVNEFRFYDLGAKLERIKGIKQDSKVTAILWDCWQARQALQQLLDDPIDLKVCRPAAEKVIEAIDSCVPKTHQQITRLSKDKDVGFAAHNINVSLSRLITVLEAECLTLNTYAVSQKRAYSTSDMISNAEVTVSRDIRDRLSHAVVKDIQEAGRCLVFDLPTAAGFHILRAVELVMADLWAHVIQGQSKKPANWGKYIEELDNAGVDKNSIDMLTRMKNLYRNPVAHPDIVLTEEEAFGLFSIGVAAIEHLVAQLPE